MAELQNSFDMEDGVADEMTIDHPKDSELPPGYLQDTSSSVKALDMKTIKLMLSSVCGGYTRCSNEKKLQYLLWQ